MFYSNPKTIAIKKYDNLLSKNWGQIFSKNSSRIFSHKISIEKFGSRFEIKIKVLYRIITNRSDSAVYCRIKAKSRQRDDSYDWSTSIYIFKKITFHEYLTRTCWYAIFKRMIVIDRRFFYTKLIIKWNHNLFINND